ncbi:unnamed protein product [Rhodiola kirilowii]
MNSELLKEISEEEVKNAIFSMGPLKAPGIDGFPAIFYQKYWDKVKSSIMWEVNRFWLEGILDKELNRTLITLIPKKKEAIRMEDWRPISLCTVAMKVITKIIATRLQPLLDKVISPFQSAFVKGRMITGNFVVAHEIAHYLKKCRGRGDYYASIKVDMSKAYDHAEWAFLEKLLLRMGFADIWVERVMCCVRSVSYQVKVNDSISNVIKPGRGLRQGDPLSPYLLLFCTELLNAKLRLSVDEHLMSGIKICRRAPTVSHLLFADDSIFFIKVNNEEARHLKYVLNCYEKVSGQRINFEKSEICFSRNSPADIRVEICDILGVSQVPCHSKYLGLPLIVGQRKSEMFRSLLEKIWKKISDWRCKLLSSAGREVLIKAVIQALPVYMMSVYYFPRRVIDEIAKMISQFWWNKEGRKGTSWVNQKILQEKKYEGGLGFKFKELSIFNEAILMKIAWRMIKKPHLLMSRILAAKYCNSGDVFSARLSFSPSHVWRGLMRGLKLF